MDVYQIVRIGDPPGNQGAENLGSICAEWASSSDKHKTEVIAVSLTKGVVTRRFTAAEAEEIARDFLNPKI